MTKVKDLINENSDFIKADGFDNLKPEVTITLPTYKRGDNGLFKICVESLLSQTFQNFELIIVDDASTDSTFSQIQEFMKKDSRIAVIRHRKNIGLPAVSELEAFFVARSEKFFYAFDDNEFKPNAIEVLYNCMISNQNVKIVHGISEIKAADNNNYFVGKKNYTYEDLNIDNYIPNSPLLLHKDVINKVGYYDPHIAITRLCDWDLWIRIGREFNIYKVQEILVLEKGVVEKDSLTYTYPLSRILVKEWMNLNRNEKLKPENILEYVIDFKPIELSQDSKKIIDVILKNKFSNFFWYNIKKLITVLVPVESACTGFIFDTLPKETKNKIEIKTYEEFNNELEKNLLQTNILIFAREINFSTILFAQLCTAFKVPYYYYTDDNFFELGIVPKTDEIINFIKSCKACILSSNTLIDYFKENNLNDNFHLVVPAISDEQKDKLIINLNKYDKPKQINLLYASNHRIDGILKMSNVFIELAKEYSLKFFIFQRMERMDELMEFDKICSQNNISIEYLASYSDHRLFIEKIANLNIHFILHPQSFNNDVFTLNHKYKTLNFLINAYLSSSLIFVPNLEPYSELNKEGIISNLVYNNSDEIYTKIKEILNSPEYTKKLFESLQKYCLTNFEPKINEKIFLDIIESFNGAKITNLI